MLFFPALILGLFLIDRKKESSLLSLSMISFIIILLCVIYIIVAIHEGVHYFCHIIIGHIPFSKVEYHLFPFPYVLCKDTTNVRAYRINDLLPGILAGILPLVLGITFNNLFLFLAASICLAGASSDWIVLYKLLKYSGDLLVQDFTDKAGCRVHL